MQTNSPVRVLLFLSLLTMLARPATAASVTGLSAQCRNGQTFITWTVPPGTDWIYKIYCSSSVILDETMLTSGRVVATVGDSTWCDKRLTSLSGITSAYVLDSLAAPLQPTQGLFVDTPVANGARYFAVTVQKSGTVADRTIVLGQNSLAQPVTEIVAEPRPVFQRMVQEAGCSGALYTLWVSNRATPYFPAMTNRRSKAFDHIVHLGTPDSKHALMFLPHAYGGGFYPPACVGEGDYVLKLDDQVAVQDPYDFWFGFSEQYNPESYSNIVPTDGLVQDYTARRVLFTLLWARRTFPVDTTKVYVAGGSMGGICAVFLSLWHPNLIAAAWANVPLVSFASQSDPNPYALFNQGNHYRQGCDRFWGEVESDLRMADGGRVFERLDASTLAASHEGDFVPPLITFNGRNDQTVGWADKISFYRAMRDSRGGGTFYWDNRDHLTAIASAWKPMMDYGIPYMYRYRTNLSFPAFSNCSADWNPGNGQAMDGDSVGTINGYLDFDPAITDDPVRWIVRLGTRDPLSQWGKMIAPDSMTVNVTPRRLQRFLLTPGYAYPYTVQRAKNLAVVRQGMAFADGFGVVTIPGVKVYKDGSILTIGLPKVAEVGPGLTPLGPRPVIAPVPSPLRVDCAFAVTWIRGGNVSVDLLDLAGRRMKSLWQGGSPAGLQRLQLDLAGVPSGAYSIVAREGEAIAVRRIVVLR